MIRALVALCAMGAGPQPAVGFKAVAFSEASSLARNDELIKRIFSPFAAADMAAKNGTAALGSFPIDPKDEKFGLYVPTQKPARGYGLLVWVSPLDGAGIPPGWSDVMRERGVIYVTAARSGNFTDPLGRRIPLALTAAANVAAQYDVDPDRVWIAGFSGGSRIAERMALAFPDVFTGAILDGSSDPIESQDISPPSRERFGRFLDRTAIVVSTGKLDRYNTRDAKRFIASMHRHCFNRLSVEVRPREEHQVMNGGSLASAIDFLDQPREVAGPADLQCRERLYSTIDADLGRAELMVKRGSKGAMAALRVIDRRYGQLAAPRSLDLRARLGF